MMSKQKNPFQKEHPFDKRKLDSERIVLKYPDRIPIIVQNIQDSLLPPLDKKKYLAPRDLTLGQFIYVIRKRIQLEPETAIFMFVNNTLPATSSSLSTIYNEQKNEDGFLYLDISGESTFG